MSNEVDKLGHRLENAETFEERIKLHAEFYVKDVIEDVANKACMELRDKIRKAADSFALKILKRYEIHQCRDRIIIEVKKNLE